MRLSRSRLRRMILQEIRNLNERVDTTAVDAELNDMTAKIKGAKNKHWRRISGRLLDQYGTRDKDGNVLTLRYGNEDFSNKAGLMVTAQGFANLGALLADAIWKDAKRLPRKQMLYFTFFDPNNNHIKDMGDLKFQLQKIMRNRGMLGEILDQESKLPMFRILRLSGLLRDEWFDSKDHKPIDLSGDD